MTTSSSLSPSSLTTLSTSWSVSATARTVAPPPPALQAQGKHALSRQYSRNCKAHSPRCTCQRPLILPLSSASGAPTGTAAFNMRFNATTIHRLIHWFRPPYFKELAATDDRLHALQKHLASTWLLILDEISMVGRQMMGRIDSRTTQARAGNNPLEFTLGGISCVGVGDPAQCEAMRDQQIYDVKPHKKSVEDLDQQHVLLSNRGLHVYSEFTKVVVHNYTPPYAG